MDEFYLVYKTTMDRLEEMRQLKAQQLQNLKAILNKKDAADNKENIEKVESGNGTPATKRVKRLSALEENEATINEANSTTNHEEALEAVELMPPPAAPALSATTSDQSFSRPQRAAKLNCGKHLKEPPLNTKLRRPDESEVHIKLEHEQRASQIHKTELQQKKQASISKSNASIASTSSQDSVFVLPSKTPSIVTIASQSDQSTVANDPEKSNALKENDANTVTRELSVRIKREKISTVGIPNHDDETKKQIPQKETTTLIEPSVFSATTTTTTTVGDTTHETTAQGKKGQRKKKTVPRPIKVERLSGPAENEPSTPVAARTRGANNSKMEETAAATGTQNATVYEEANDKQQQTVLEQPSTASKHINTPTLNNETITIAQKHVVSIGGVAATTNSTTPSNATMILGTAPNNANDLTFDVASASKDGTESQRSSDQSMATARDTLQPRAESLMTEDESDVETPASKAVPVSKKPMPKMNTLPFAAAKKAAALPPAKSYKLPVREIFNPLIQSPVKKKVEAFESVAAANKNSRSRLAKENSKPQMSTSSTSTTTPLIGKPTTSAAASSRYLTPTQSGANLVTPNAMLAAKKFPASASKALGLTKSNSADKIWMTASAKAPAREHSAEDFRRGTQQLAEERKKQRDQRHLQAAQQREAKERERAERLAKAAKEREEKRLKKQQLADQKQRELQEIQRKLKQQEEAAAAAAAAEVAAQREKLAKLALQQNAASGNSAKARMPPPQPKSKYTFEMLHEDDSTDDEGKVTYKRPPPPTWSLSHVRGPAILAQQHVPNEIVDCLFSVQPRTLDLKTIFPQIDPRYLKRNSSAFWQTPPRYSELPKY